MMTLDSVRDSLIGQEDIIIFCLIERAKYPINSPLYAESLAGVPDSLVKYIVKETEALHAKVTFTAFDFAPDFSLTFNLLGILNYFNLVCHVCCCYVV